MTPADFKVGQTLCAVYGGGRVVDVVVTKVGRQWVTFTNPASYRDNSDRFAPADGMALDGGQYTSPGRVYLSRDAYAADLEIDLAWGDFRKAFQDRYRAPAGLTAAEIRAFTAKVRGE